MEHQFNVELAIKYGIEKAILIHNLAWWIKKNIANNTHFHEERYWTYNSSKAFSELFPYMSESKIKRLLLELETKDSVLISGNFNKIPFDRTKWYSITDDYIAQIYSIHCSNLNNGEKKNNQAIPDIKPVSKQTDNKHTTTEKEKLFEDWWNKYNVKDRGSKSVAKKLFIKLTLQDIELVKKHTDYYVKNTEQKYRKNGDRYLRERIFECEIENKQDTKPSIDTKIVNRIGKIEMLLDTNNIIYEKDKLFLEETLTDDRYSKYRYILDKIDKAEIV